MSDEEPKAPPDKPADHEAPATGVDAPKPEPTILGLGGREQTVLGVGAPAHEKTVLGIGDAAPAPPAAPPSPAAPPPPMREATILGVGEAPKAAALVVAADSSVSGLSKKALAETDRSNIEVPGIQIPKVDVPEAIEPASAPRKGGAWKWIVVVVLGGAAIALFLDRERIARELSPPPAPKLPAPLTD